MRSDNMGFKYPSVDASLCTNCGACEKACPFDREKAKLVTHATIEAYAARHRDEKELTLSQSGAAFVAISDFVLRQGGIVYGVSFDEQFRVVHSRATTAGQRDRMRGSKYVQSDLGDVFREVEEDLRASRTVLFVGTPCQVAGLNAVLDDGLKQGLLTVSLLCYGVASPAIWEEALEWIERKYGKRIESACFRDKKFGWHSCRESFRLSGGTVLHPDTRVFRKSFFRPSCGECPFASMNRSSDLSIGDFWGVENVFPAMGEDNKGCSLVLCSTAKGKEAFDQMKQDLDCRKVEEMSQCLQPCLIHPVSLPRKARFIALFYRKGMFSLSLGWRKMLYIVKSNAWKIIHLGK